MIIGVRFRLPKVHFPILTVLVALSNGKYDTTVLLRGLAFAVPVMGAPRCSFLDVREMQATMRCTILRSICAGGG